MQHRGEADAFSLPSALFTSACCRESKRLMQEPVTPSELQSRNRILAGLPREDYERLAAHLTPVNLSQGQLIYHVDDTIKQVYFPTDSMVSLVSQLSDGTSVEVGVVGFEGIAGLPLLLGVNRSPHEMMCQIPGGAMQASAEAIKREFKSGGALHDLLLRYTQSLMLTISQSMACNRIHSIGERLARWLLMSYDRCPSDELPLTQEFLAAMLGTRRAGVTEAAIKLQTEGVIKYKRGHIRIEDKKGLEACACECYGIIKQEFDRQTSAAFSHSLS